MNKKGRVWIEVRYNTISQCFNNIQLAREFIKESSKGFPKQKLSKENKKYWRNVSKEMIVVKVTQTEKLL